MQEGAVLFIAPGQGTLRPNLIELAQQVPEVMETYELADEISIEIFGADKKVEGRSISEWAAIGTDEEFAGNTIIAQPLIVATSIGLIKYLKKWESPTTVYGHSLGELSALFAAGSLSDRDAIGLAMLRGLYSFEASADQSGKMAALFNVSHDLLAKLKFGEEEGVVISTDNSPDQFTVSGYADKVTAMANQVKESVARVKGLSKEERRQLPNAVVLKVGSGFHSFMMRPAQKAYREALDGVELSVPNLANFFSNHSHDYEASPSKIKDHLVEQLISPVLFWKDINQLIEDGHRRILETGPSSVLSKELRAQQLKGNLLSLVEVLSVEKNFLAEAAYLQNPLQTG